jgi:competence protein ComEC
VLVDGGPDPDRLVALLDARLPAWDRRIDVVVLTHPHEDHAAGLVGLIGRYRLGHLFEPGMRGPGPGYTILAGVLAARGPRPGQLAAGDRFAVDDGRFRVLWPDPGSVPAEPPDTGKGINNVSIVLELTIGSRRVLLMGDAEEEVDPVLLRRGLRRADVLKVAHHGSATATSAAFLAAVGPGVAVVSAGAKNRYGHPAASTIERLASAGARVLRTDHHGSVTVATDGSALRVTTERDLAEASGPKLAARPSEPRVRSARWPTPGALRSPSCAARKPPHATPERPEQPRARLPEGRRRLGRRTRDHRAGAGARHRRRGRDPPLAGRRGRPG